MSLRVVTTRHVTYRFSPSVADTCFHYVKRSEETPTTRIIVEKVAE